MSIDSKYGWKCENIYGGSSNSCAISEWHLLPLNRLKIVFAMVSACAMTDENGRVGVYVGK